jgi:2-polyprenyl-3-methyl-5-hydroxy-6-metoxy-1,4-benzoquinol methylase
VKDADSSDQLALEFWTNVIDPLGIGMPAAIAAEIASFTGEPVDLVQRKMETGKDDLKRLWEESHIDVSDAHSVASFYRDQFVEAYELANWHCGNMNGSPPLNYARAALLARAQGLTRALDFGSGIGSGSLALASAGCEVHSADIAEQLLGFVEHRMRSRGYPPVTINLDTAQRPSRGYYDLITCFDVLEHIPDQFGKICELASYLRPGGYLLVNLMSDSSHPDRPMHISSAGSWLPMLRRTSLVPYWAGFAQEMQAFMHWRTGRLRNWVASWRD